MKKLLVLIGLLFSSLTFPAVSWDETKQIYSKLVRSNHLYISPRLVLVDHINGNYYQAATRAPWQSIFITRGLLNKLNRDEIAFTLGHELGHYIKFHLSSNYKNEFAADKKGVRYSSRAGYNSCKGIQWLRNAKGSATHPPGKQRIKAVGCQ